MPKPRSGQVRHETGRGRNTARVRLEGLPRAPRRRHKPGTIELIEFRPPLENPEDIGTEYIWGSRAQTSTSAPDQQQPE